MASRFVEDWGNIRLQRIAFGYSPAAPPEHGHRLFLRLTGLADHNRLKEYLRKEMQVTAVREENGPNGEPVTWLSSEKGPCGADPRMAVLVGDTDLFLAVGEEPDKSLKAMEQVLEVRAGKQASLLKGKWAATLQEIPENACGLLIGEPPDSMPKEAGEVEGPLPRRIVAYLIADERVDIHFAAVMRNAKDAQTFAENLLNYRERNIAPLQGRAQSPSAAVLIQAWESIKVETNGLEVRGEAHISGDVPSAIVGLFTEGLNAFFAPLASALASIVCVGALVGVLLAALLFVIVVAVIAAAAFYLRGKMTRATK
jgi:hypothetical protein